VERGLEQLKATNLPDDASEIFSQEGLDVISGNQTSGKSLGERRVLSSNCHRRENEAKVRKQVMPLDELDEEIRD
jgi:hypothetical protein